MSCYSFVFIPQSTQNTSVTSEGAFSLSASKQSIPQQQTPLAGRPLIQAGSDTAYLLKAPDPTGGDPFPKGLLF